MQYVHTHEINFPLNLNLHSMQDRQKIKMQEGFNITGNKTLCTSTLIYVLGLSGWWKVWRDVQRCVDLQYYTVLLYWWGRICEGENVVFGFYSVDGEGWGGGC